MVTIFMYIAVSLAFFFICFILVVKVELVKTDGEQFISLKQQRFSSVHKNNINILWQIPVQILVKPTAEDDPVILETFLFKEKDVLIPLPELVDLGRGGLVKLNHQFISYFRHGYCARKISPL